MNDFRKAIASNVTLLCEVFNKSPTELTFRGYEFGLTGLHPDEVDKATKLALQKSRFMPSPAELRELVRPTYQDYATENPYRNV